jgi:hypothetical protein
VSCAIVADGSFWTPSSTASSIKPQLLLTTALGGAVRVSILQCSSTAVFTTPTTLRYMQPHHSSSSTDATTAACFVQCSSSSAVTVALSSSGSNSSTHSSGVIAFTGLAYELQHGSVQEVYDTDLDHLLQHRHQQLQSDTSSYGAAHTSVASHIVKSSSTLSAAATAAAQRKAAQVGRYNRGDSPPPRQQPPDLSNGPLAAELLTQQLLSQQWGVTAAAASGSDDDAAYSALLSSQNSISSELAAAAVEGEGGLELRSPPRSRAGTGLSSRGHTVASVGRIVVRTVSSTAAASAAAAAAAAAADTVVGTVMSPQCALVTQQSYAGSALSLGESLPVRAATAPAAALAAAATAEFVVPGTTENSVASSAQQHLQQLLEDDASSLSGAVSEIAMSFTSETRSSSASASNVLLQRSSSTASTTAGAAASAVHSHPSKNNKQQQQQQRGLKRARYRSLCTTATRFEYNSMGERVRVQIPLTELEGYGGPREELRYSGKFSLARTPAPAVPTVSTVACHIEALTASTAVLQTNPALQQGLPRAFAQCWTAQGRDVSESGSSSGASGISAKGKGGTTALAREALDVAEAVGVQCCAKALYAVYMHRYDAHTRCRH